MRVKSLITGLQSQFHASVDAERLDETREIRSMNRIDAIENLTLALLYLTRFNDGERNHAPFNELAWKNYDFDAINRLDAKGLINDIRTRRGRANYAYLTEAGREKAREIVEALGVEDKDLYQRFEFRSVRPEEADQAADIEAICFPPNEACTRQRIKERIAVASDTFLVAVDRETGKIAGFINGIATDEMRFRDAFFTDASLHNPKGNVLMILGLDVLPEYRKQGLGRELVYGCCRREQEKGRRMAMLTCHDKLVRMYKRMGFVDHGESESTWGGEKWHEMYCLL